MKRRLLSIFLVFAMALGMLPGTALADEEAEQVSDWYVVQLGAYDTRARAEEGVENLVKWKIIDSSNAVSIFHDLNVQNYMNPPSTGPYFIRAYKGSNYSQAAALYSALYNKIKDCSSITDKNNALAFFAYVKPTVEFYYNSSPISNDDFKTYVEDITKIELAATGKYKDNLSITTDYANKNIRLKIENTGEYVSTLKANSNGAMQNGCLRVDLGKYFTGTNQPTPEKLEFTPLDVNNALAPGYKATVEQVDSDFPWHWEVTLTDKLYTVNYNLNYEGAPEAPDAKTGVKWKDVDLLPDDEPSREGYTFTGWYTAKSAGTNVADDTKYSDIAKDDAISSVTLYAQWSANDANYTVEHYKQNLEGDGYTQAETETVGAVTGATVTAKSKAYEGFEYNPNVEGTIREGTIPTNGNLVLRLYYTRNSYNVSYEYEGTVPEGAPQLGTGTIYGTTSYKYGADVTVADKTTADGYTFYGWDTSDATISDNHFTMPAKDVKLTGSWKKNVTITITGCTDTKVYTGSEQTVSGFKVSGTPDGVSVDLKSGEKAEAKGTDASETKYMMGLTKDHFDVTGADNFSVTLKVTDGWLLITKETAAETLTANSYSGTYDAESHGITVSGTVAGDTLYYSTDNSTWSIEAPSRKDVQEAETIYVKAENPNYETRTANATITITPKPVTVTADDKSKSYGAADPELTATVDGTLNDDTVAYSVTRAAGENVGTYTITPSGEATQGNYAVTYETGTLTIIAANTNGVTANGCTVVYDGEPHSITAEAVQTGSTLYYSVDSGETKTWSNENPTFTEVGTYTVYVYATNPNYADTAATSATVTITPRPAAITVDDAQKVAGTEDPAFTGRVAGLVNANDLGTITYSRTNSDEDVGTYDDVLDAAYTENGNYTVTVIKGDFTITEPDVPALTVDKTVSTPNGKNTVEVGDTIRYTIVVKNIGEIDLINVTVKEFFGGDIDRIELSLPEGVQKIDADEYLLTSLKTGESVEINFTYKTRNADAGKLTNMVVVEGVYDDNGTPNDLTDDKKVTDTDKSIDITVEREYYRPPVIPSKPTLNYQDHVAYIIGYEDGTVRPQNSITRAEVATIFFRLLSDESRKDFWTQDNEYTDVKLTAWYNNAVSTLSNAGIVTGYPDGNFRSDAPITRAEFAAIAARFSEVIYNGGNSFSDVPENHWAARYIALAEHLGWINGYPDGTFKPDQDITRAEAMTLINRVLERAVEMEHMLPDMVIWVDNRPDDWFYEAVQEATNSHTYSRLNKRVSEQDFNYEDWQKILDVPDWAALENAWSTVNSK